LACACFFAAAAAVLAQIFTSARTANIFSTILLVVLMAPHIGWNVKGSMGGIMYLSPLEWPLLIRAFAGERFEVLIIASLIIGLLTYLALKLSSMRELEAGFIPEHSGRASARPGFKSVLSLSWRMQKGSFGFWLTFFAFIGFLLGSVSQTLANISSTAPSLAGFVERLGGTDRAFMSLMIYEITLIFGIYPILAVQHARAEESSLRADILLALPVSRLRYYVSHLIFAFAGTGVIMAVMGLTLGIGAAAATGDSGEFTRLLIETIVKIPAVWVIAGIAAFLFGLIPRGMTGISFTMLGIFILLEFFYEQGAVSHAIFSISPFAQVYPTNPITALPIIGLLLVSFLLVVLGELAYQKRDIAS
jgi:ABC-2 type transport system permease protein